MKLPFNIIKYLIILSSMNNKEKGDIYEKFIHEYLLEQEFTNECYLYKDVHVKILCYLLTYVNISVNNFFAISFI